MRRAGFYRLVSNIKQYTNASSLTNAEHCEYYSIYDKLFQVKNIGEPCLHPQTKAWGFDTEDYDNVCAKMTIFCNLGYIDAGIEVVPVKSFADDMSTGVSYFEQFVWDLETRGVADIDIPVLIFGIDV